MPNASRYLSSGLHVDLPECFSPILLLSSSIGLCPVVIVAQQSLELHVRMHGLTCLSCTLYNSAYLTMPLTVPSRPVMKGEPQDDAQRHRQSRLMQSVEVLLSLGTSNPELWANVRVTEDERSSKGTLDTSR